MKRGSKCVDWLASNRKQTITRDQTPIWTKILKKVSTKSTHLTLILVNSMRGSLNYLHHVDMTENAFVRRYFSPVEFIHAEISKITNIT